MTQLNLVIAPDPILEQMSLPVEAVGVEIKQILEEMIQVMYKMGGIGLAAVQVGLLRRMMVVHVKDIQKWQYSDLSHLDGYTFEGGPFCIVNPEIVESSSNIVAGLEGCLSLPKQRYDVLRPDAITLKYTDQDGKEQLLKAAGWLGRCIQHELDHLNGKLFISRLSGIKRAIATKKARQIKRSLAPA